MWDVVKLLEQSFLALDRIGSLQGEAGLDLAEAREWLLTAMEVIVPPDPADDPNVQVCA